MIRVHTTNESVWYPTFRGVPYSQPYLQNRASVSTHVKGKNLSTHRRGFVRCMFSTLLLCKWRRALQPYIKGVWLGCEGFNPWFMQMRESSSTLYQGCMTRVWRFQPLIYANEGGFFNLYQYCFPPLLQTKMKMTVLQTPWFINVQWNVNKHIIT